MSSNLGGFGEGLKAKTGIKEKWVRQVDSDKEAQRDREGVSKGEMETASQAEDNQEPVTGMRRLPDHLPQVCWHSQLFCPRKDNNRTSSSGS